MSKLEKITYDEVKKNSKLVKSFKEGIFTFAESSLEIVVEPATTGKTPKAAKTKTFYGIGLARKGKDDRLSEVVGTNTAVGRSQKACYLKANGLPVNSPFMG